MLGAVAERFDRDAVHLWIVLFIAVFRFAARSFAKSKPMEDFSACSIPEAWAKEIFPHLLDNYFLYCFSKGQTILSKGFKDFNSKVVPGQYHDMQEYWFSRIHEDDIVQQRQKLKETIFLYEHKYRVRSAKHNNSYRWIESRASYLPKFKCKLGCVRDITDQVEAEAALKTAKEAAEKAAKIKQEFLSNMSHELRTPLNGILGLTSLLLETKLNDDQHEMVSNIHECSSYLLSSVDDILDFHKTESGKMKLQKTVINLLNLVKSSFSVIRTCAKMKGLQTSYEIDSKCPEYVSLDDVRVKQVLVNVLGNAVKYTDNGFVILKVSLNDTRRSGNRAVLRFSVEDSADSGIGIRNEELPYIFDPFQQADSSNTRRHQGTGLGLAISSRLIKLMDGEISVTSEWKRGSTFTFTVPFDKSQVSLSPPMTPPLLEPLGIKKVLHRMLSSLGCEHVDIVENGLQAVHKAIGDDGSDAEEAQCCSYDLILMDVMMPAMDGLDATRKIRQKVLKSDKTTPWIVAVTANVLKSERERIMQSGMDYFLTKPVNKSQLEDILLKIQDKQEER